ncbi:SDR family oxidoreductase [Nocardioides sp. AX2bis]|uniref:SDR family oxidoreductase n=1 Tax=Nocardioides sp. AX2bis TaxID=2653157 RepID=UPI0012F00E37|nr:SDR family oxidoreductase [Nocardioides sp. AX2bis]VXB45926.1 Short-chain dehydrogenase [Nocardioides sp. AX2bis]
MSYFVTGATGFIGRHLVTELLANREGDVFVLVREGSRGRLDTLRRGWDSDRVVPVVGDLGQQGLGVDPAWVSEHAGEVEHVFHLAAIYDMTADAATNEALNVDGTRHALGLAEALDAGCFHQVSSVAAAGDFQGRFDETMFAEGQHLPSPYHRTKYESERIVREESAVPWRVYRPAIVVGHSETGVMDKVDGPYYFFPALKALRGALPSWVPLAGMDLGRTNLVPVDYVAAAMDHLAHLPGHDGEAFHLVDPDPQPVVDAFNAFGTAAGAPTFRTPVESGLAKVSSRPLLPRALRPASLLNAVVRTAPAQALLDQTVGRLGLPAEVLAHTSFTAVFDSRRTEKLLAGSGIAVPDLDSYAALLWSYWEEHLDTATARDPKARAALEGKHVVITGASSGIGQVVALKVAQAGGIPVLVARGKDKLEQTRAAIELRGGTAHVYPCDLSDLDAIDELCARLAEDLPTIDVVVNNAGRSIRRSLRLSEDRFHDFERTMQLNYFGAIRLVMGLLPPMRDQRNGHVVNISSIGVQTSPPRFSAYVASKAALDAWSNVVASELVGDGVTFTGIHMPLVRTPMIAPTKLYDKFPTISPAQAADLVIRAVVDRPHEINTLLGNAGAVVHTVAPKAAFRVLNMAYHVFPDSAAAKGTVPEGGARETEQIMLARVLRGVHW